MSEKRKRATDRGRESTARKNLPQDLDERLRVVWQSLGHLIDWCDSSTAWTQLFCAESRPYRETFYWEAVAHMVSNYLLKHSATDPADALTDCLIATQCSTSSDDGEALTEFRSMWEEILSSSRAEMQAFIQADLELARQEGTSETVAALYANNCQAWERT